MTVGRDAAWAWVLANQGLIAQLARRWHPQTQHVQDVNDSVQGAMLVAYRAYLSYDGRCPFPVYLSVCVRRHLRDRGTYRKGGVRHLRYTAYTLPVNDEDRERLYDVWPLPDEQVELEELVDRLVPDAVVRPNNWHQLSTSKAVLRNAEMLSNGVAR